MPQADGSFEVVYCCEQCGDKVRRLALTIVCRMCGGFMKAVEITPEQAEIEMKEAVEDIISGFTSLLWKVTHELD